MSLNNLNDLNSLNEKRKQYALIEKALLYLIDQQNTQPSLDAVAEHIGVSSYHLQKTFKRWAGISPKQFLQYITKEKAKEQLLQSRPVLETSIHAGLSTPSRLHDLMITTEAVTPGEMSSNGEKLKIVYGWHPTPFGHCFIAITPRGICQLSFTSLDDDEPLITLTSRWPKAEINAQADKTLPFLKKIFTSEGDLRTLPLHLKGTNFQLKVWEALMKIPEGALCTYQQVAKAIENPKACRAVGSAVGHNPIAYIIPCHRVIRGSGVLGNYHWGPERKQAILVWEQQAFKK